MKSIAFQGAQRAQNRGGASKFIIKLSAKSLLSAAVMAVPVIIYEAAKIEASGIAGAADKVLLTVACGVVLLAAFVADMSNSKSAEK